MLNTPAKAHHPLEHQGGLNSCSWMPSHPPFPSIPGTLGCISRATVVLGACRSSCCWLPGFHLLDGLMSAFPTFLQLCLGWAVSRQSWQLARNFKMKLWGSFLNAEVCISVCFGEENTSVHQFCYHGIEGKVRRIKMAFLCLTLHFFWWWSAHFSRKFRNKNVLWFPKLWMLAQWGKCLCLRVRKRGSKLFTNSSVKARPAEPGEFKKV